jgi:U3 small nucleolar RNA-associated protein 10
MRMIYRLANTFTAAPRLTVDLLQTLFVNLKDDALAFLAGIWINGTMKNVDEVLLGTVAVRHAAAFLEAHIGADDGTDFQTIFPAILVALQSHDVNTRHAALACIWGLRRLADRRFTAVYKFDIVYGQSESECCLMFSIASISHNITGIWVDQLQYLDREDFKRYLDALGEYSDHLAHDVKQVKVFHQQHLVPDKTDKKRDAEYVQHCILSFSPATDSSTGINTVSCATCSRISTHSGFRVRRLPFSRLSSPYQTVQRPRCYSPLCRCYHLRQQRPRRTTNALWNLLI